MSLAIGIQTRHLPCRPLLAPFQEAESLRYSTLLESALCGLRASRTHGLRFPWPTRSQAVARMRGGLKNSYPWPILFGSPTHKRSFPFRRRQVHAPGLGPGALTRLTR